MQRRVGNAAAATLNLAGKTDTAATPSALGSEADLEKRLAGANPTERARLMAGLGLVRLDRQLPVGVFHGSPARGSAMFTGGKSAIDLVGLDETGALWLFELKTAQNIKAGALFYTMVMHDVRQGRIAFDQLAGPRSTIMPAQIIAAPRIHARLLADASHPLLSAAVFEVPTRAVAERGWPLDFGFHKLGACLNRTGEGQAV